MKRIELTEFGDRVLVELTDSEQKQLTRASQEWKTRLGLPSPPLVLDQQSQLSARHVTGVLRIGNFDIEIAPKFLKSSSTTQSAWRRALWQILAIVDVHGQLGDLTSSTSSETVGLQDLVADSFMASIRRGTARGWPRRYVESSSMDRILHGSLDTGRLMQWMALPWLVPSRTDALTEDTEEARLLSWAADQLASSVISSRRAKHLEEVAFLIGKVGRRPQNLASARRIRVGPPFNPLQRAIDISVLLMEGRGEDYGSGALELNGFLWKSDDVYESFVFELCQRAARGTLLHAEKRQLKLGVPLAGVGRGLSTTPDVLFRDRTGAVVAVVDAKYKTFGTAPKAADTYQVYAAAHVTGASRVGLTYPVASDDSEPSGWLIESALAATPVELWAIPLNLMRVADVDGVANLVLSIRSWLPPA